MRTLDIIRRSGRNLSQAKGRTALTATAIAIGAFAIITSLALGNGTKDYMSNLIGTNINERQMQVNKKPMQAVNFGPMGSGIKEYSESFDNIYRTEMLTDADIAKIRKVEGVEKVLPFQMFSMKYFTIEGSDKKWTSSLSSYDPLIKNESLTGKLPSEGINIGQKDIAIPESYLKNIGISEQSIIGQKVRLVFAVPMTEENIKLLNIDPINTPPAELANKLERTYEFNVIAVLKTVPLSFGSSTILINEQKYVEIGDDINRGTPSHKKYISAITEVEKGMKAEDIKQKIIDETGLSPLTAKDAQKMLFQFVNILQGVVIGFGILALLVSVFGIINTMYVSVLERTNQIGLMKALGMQNKHVSRMFRYEAAWIGFIGSTMGIVISWIVGTAMNPWMSDQVGLKGTSITLLNYDLFQAVVLIVVLVLVAIISSLLPARKAAKLDPIEALRTE